MAARRLASSTVNWTEFATKIPESQRASFNALKNKTDNYVRKIASLPESSPKIDFSAYKSRIAVAGMVDNFQKSYEGLQVPYPKDTLSSSIDGQASQQKSAYEKFVSESKTRIVAMNEEKARWEAMMPVEEMNLEEALEAVPHMTELVRDPKNPTMFPHDEDYEAALAKVKQMTDDH